MSIYLQHTSEIFQAPDAGEPLTGIGDLISQYRYLFDINNNKPSHFTGTAYAPYMQHASKIFQSPNMGEPLRSIGDPSSRYTHLFNSDNKPKATNGFEGTAYAPYMNNAPRYFR